MATVGENVFSSTKLEKLFSMKGGKGEFSYANNSQAQANHFKSALHLLEETLDKVPLCPSKAPFVVADLGCSSGSNTIFIVDVIVKRITKRYEALGYDLPEFSVLFSDLPSNDFNTLFQLLPPVAIDGGSAEESLAPTNERRAYFAAGVPGTFYRRLFPARSIDFFHSSISLQWLSQVPDTVMDKRSNAYNEGKVFVHGAKESTANAYRKQFQSDLGSFLRSRSLEMKKDGSMFLVCSGRTSSDPTDQSGPGVFFGTHVQDAWDDLVQEGLISKEKRDSFNIPFYSPSLQEFKDVVEADGSFSLNKLELIKGGSLVVNRPDDTAEVGRALANNCRAVCGVLVEEHIGEQLCEELFLRAERRAASHGKELLDQLQFYYIVASLSLS